MTRLSSLFQRGRQSPRWKPAIQQAIRELAALNASTERDFLAVGGKLVGIRDVASEVSSQIAALSEALSGERGQKVAGALNGMLERSEAMAGETAQAGEGIESLRALAGRIRQSFGGLRQTVSAFRTLCTLARIETARLGGAGFGFEDHAEEVKRLAETIHASGQSILEACARLDGEIAAALESGAGLRGQQLRELPRMIAEVMNSLRAFEERRAHLQAESGRQAVRCREMSASLDGLVGAVQFHDITRQQVEHVIEALRQVGGAGEEAPWGAIVLQRAQLEKAASVFAASVEGIGRALERIAALVDEMAEATRAGGLSEAAGMEAGFTALIETAENYAGVREELAGVANRLDATIGRMREPVAAIRAIEVQIQWAALNGTIRAAQIGEAGNALGVIAEVMHRLAAESGRKSEEVSGALDAMSGICGRSAGKSAPGPGDRELATVRVREAVMELHTGVERAVSGDLRIAELAQRLGQEIAALRKGFVAGQQFAEVAGRTIAELARIGGREAVTEDLDGLARNYTMQMEREVHAAVAEGAEPVPAGEELGENVELF